MGKNTLTNTFTHVPQSIYTHVPQSIYTDATGKVVDLPDINETCNETDVAAVQFTVEVNVYETH